MVAYVNGILRKKAEDHVIIESRGIGFEIQIPTNYALSTELVENEPLKIDTYLNVKEYLMELYGFEDFLQKDVFTDLISVSGISCRSAMKIISTFPSDELIIAIKEGNVKKLTLAPGLGKKTAEKLILELKDKFIKKFKNIYEVRPAKGNNYSSNIMDAIDGLVALGFAQSDVKKAVESLGKVIGGQNTQDIIKHCLKILSGS